MRMASTMNRRKFLACIEAQSVAKRAGDQRRQTYIRPTPPVPNRFYGALEVWRASVLAACGFGVERSRKRLRRSPAVAQAVAQEVLQLRHRVDLPDRRLDVVFDAAEANGVVVQQDVAGTPVAVP